MRERGLSNFSFCFFFTYEALRSGPALHVAVHPIDYGEMVMSGTDGQWSY